MSFSCFLSALTVPHRHRACHLLMRTVRAKRQLSFLLSGLLLLGCFLTPRPVTATTVVPVSDRDLAVQAVAIVVGRVVAIESQWNTEESQIFTYITLSLDEVLKGELSPGALTLKQVGGKVGDLQSWLYGSPEFMQGERVLLFLSLNTDGSARVIHLYQGKFSVFPDLDTGKEFVYRHVPSGVRELQPQGTAADAALAARGFFEFAEFKKRIRSFLPTTQGGSQPHPLHLIPPTSGNEVIEVQEQFALLDPSNPARWFQPDSGTPVTILLNSQGEPSAPGLGFDQIRAAFQAWSTVASSSLRYQDGGFTTAAGFRSDGVNAISFRDPLNQIDPPRNCGGTLAIGGYFRSGSETKVVNGTAYYRILEGDLVFNDGWQECSFYEDFNKVAEVATHELGHVLGLGHSSDPSATMYAYAHFDGRGATVTPDDAAGVMSLYPTTSGGGGGDTCTYSISPTRRTHQPTGGTGSITVISSSSCTWSATSNVPWITIPAGSSGKGNGAVTYSVAVNPSSTARTGTLTIAGKTFKVTQKGQRKFRR